jgi:Mg2+/Co2+ transporter CorB
MIPDAGTTVLLDRHPVDILLIKENMVKTVRIHPALADRHADAGNT